MASRSMRVTFRTEAAHDELETHDIDVAPGTGDAPRILENPHVDFPGRWVLSGGDDASGWIYERERERPDTNDTVAL